MDKFVITGGNRLTGEVKISGAKNAAVAIIPAVALSDGICRIENIPNITDVTKMSEILREMGAKVKLVNRSTLEIDPTTIGTCVAPYELARGLRGSYYFMGALLGKFKHAVVAMPGGCDLGVRPIDQHLKGFMALGAAYTLWAMMACATESLVRRGISPTMLRSANLPDGMEYLETQHKRYQELGY